MSLSLSAVPGILAFGVFLVFAGKDAGYPATVWYPGTLFLLGLTAVSLYARRDRFPRLSRPAIASLLCLTGLTVWTFLSIIWSDAQGDAWDGANRGLLYLLVFALFLAIDWDAESVASLLAAYALSVGVLGLSEFIAASTAANPDHYFLLGRFDEPTGYQNANCALFSIAVWPALFLASRRAVPLFLRALMLPAAGVLLELALLSQSRAWLVALPIVSLVYLAIVPGRVRSLVFALPVAAVVAAASGRVLDVYPAFQDGAGIRSALDSARGALLISGAALLLLGAGMSYVDRALWPGGVLGRRLARVSATVFSLAALVGLVLGLAWLGNPETRIKEGWKHFKTELYPRRTESHFSSGFGGRYDIYRVALREISRTPVIGAGTGNFAIDYVRERVFVDEPRYAHSVELTIVSQTGAIGGVLFAGFLVAAVLAWARRRRDGPDFSRGLRAVALVGFAYWFVHGSVDWLWEEPGLAAPAFALLGLAVSTDARRHEPATVHRRFWRRLLGGIGVIAALAAAVSLAAPWLAAKEVQVAAHGWRVKPEAAFDRLDRARRLNPLSDEPDLIAGAIASRLGDRARMASAFRRAVERNPKNWYAHLELAVSYARARQRKAAIGELELAAALNPLEPAIPLVRGLVRSGRPISTAALDRAFLHRIEFPIPKVGK